MILVWKSYYNYQNMHEKNLHVDNGFLRLIDKWGTSILHQNLHVEYLIAFTVVPKALEINCQIHYDHFKYNRQHITCFGKPCLSKTIVLPIICIMKLTDPSVKVWCERHHSVISFLWFHLMSGMHVQSIL